MWAQCEVIVRCVWAQHHLSCHQNVSSVWDQREMRNISPLLDTEYWSNVGLININNIYIHKRRITLPMTKMITPLRSGFRFNSGVQILHTPPPPHTTTWISPWRCCCACPSSAVVIIRFMGWLRSDQKWYHQVCFSIFPPLTRDPILFISPPPPQNCWIQQAILQSRHTHETPKPMPVQCCSSVFDAGPTLHRHWYDIWCLV